MNEVKAIILCNNPIALPGLREFLFFGKIAVLVVPLRNKEMQHILTPLLAESGVPLELVTKKQSNNDLKAIIEKYKPTIGLTMTFPYIIPEEILNMVPQGFVNFHYGLLPQCRGPQPILWHLLNGDTHAGITLHKIDAGIDTGDIIMQEKMPIADTDTYGMMQTKLAYLAAKQAAALLKIVSYGKLIPAVKQDETKAVYYNMPAAAALSIKWDSMTAAQIIRLCNACNPWNKGAGTTIKEWVIGITAAELVAGIPEQTLTPGTIIACNAAEGLLVKTSDNKILKLGIVYTNEGYYTGASMVQFGFQPGDVFA